MIFFLQFHFEDISLDLYEGFLMEINRIQVTNSIDRGTSSTCHLYKTFFLS